MSYYLYGVHLNKDDLGDESQTLGYLKCFINILKPLEASIQQKFPIDSFGCKNDKLRIIGTKRLLEEYDKLDANKYDITLKFGDLKYLGFNDSKEIVFAFPTETEEITAYSIYDAKTAFLENFKLEKYINYCIEKKYHPLIDFNILKLLELEKDKEKQFRLLVDKNGEWGIRGLTSTSYKNYDNSIVMYLSLLAIHKYAADKKLDYCINKAYMTDSYMHIFFEHTQPITIPEIGDVYLGIAISNGEVRNRTFSAELRYRLVNKKQQTFSAIYDHPIFSIVHSSNISTIDSKLDNLFKLGEYETSVLNFVKQIHKVEKLSEDAVYSVLKNLITQIDKSTVISNTTKKEYKKLESNAFISNILSLIEFLDKAQTITTDMDERIFIERICHTVILDLIKEKDNNNSNE